MIAIIPARGGSKGLPRKNILPISGKPLIAYTIEAALRAKCITEVIVTTDDDEIAEVAKVYGASVPFLRPDYLASDKASAVDVYIHAVEWLNKIREENISKFMVLLPTAPLRTSEDIENAYNLFYQNKATTLIAVKEADVPPNWYMDIDSNLRLKPSGFGGADNMANRQENKRYGIVCGAIYILDYQLLKTKRTYYCDDTLAFVMPENHSIDIDCKADFEYAKFLMTKL
ncbi:acylneuraminate cytidylyltransferase family protein [Desulfosporosinus burensis]